MSNEVTDKEIEDIFKEEVWPDLTHRNQTAQDTPEAYVLGGQPGAGKSNLERAVEATHGNNFVTINGDDFRRHHPNFDEIEEKHGLDSTKYTGEFAGKITGMALVKAREEKLNVLVEGTFRTTETPLKTLSDFKEAGYNNNVMIATCPKEVSWSSTLKRYSGMHEVGNTPRFTPKAVHDLVVDNLAENTQEVADSGLVDEMSIYNRSGKIYGAENSLETNPKKAVESELRRQLTPEEHKDVANSYKKMQQTQQELNAPSEEKFEIDKQFNDYTSRAQNEQSNESRILNELQNKMIDAGYSGSELTTKMASMERDVHQKANIQEKEHNNDQDMEL